MTQHQATKNNLKFYLPWLVLGLKSLLHTLYSPQVLGFVETYLHLSIKNDLKHEKYA